jgi:predicted ATPase/DNA-binding SARP family transcriptional activator
VIEIGVLGSLTVSADGMPVPIPGRRERCVLANLALCVGEVVPMTALLDRLWGDGAPRTAHKSVQTAVANLRAAMRGLCDEGEASGLRTEGRGYRLLVDPRAVDVVRFVSLAEFGREALARSAGAEALEALSEALTLWRGTEPAELGDGTEAAIEVQRLRERRLEVLVDRLDAELLVGRHDAVLAELGSLCDTWPHRERFHELLMLALYRSGRQADALAVYRRLRSCLVEELGIEPGSSARDLERRILDQDPGLLPPPPHRLLAVRATTARPVTRGRAGLRTLVGRDDVLDELRASLDGRPLVTLVGPGGIGKTSLAKALAADVDDRVTVWCGLSAVQDPEALVPALATEVGVRQTAGVTMLEAVRDSLASGPTLLVLDSCEHLLDAAVDVVDSLLAHCSSLTVLATSRERLFLPGETVWPIEGLALPGEGPDARHAPSVELFAQRAAEADPHFDLAGALDAVSQICRRLDGMPLAIELAASRVRALPPKEIAKRLDNRFDLLVGGRRTGEPRHRTLRATVEWSHDLLGERQQRLFRRLAVFAGPFTLEGAEAVGARHGLARAEIPALLADLVDKSMVVVRHAEPDTQYRLLDTLRAFANDELAKAAEADMIERAYVAFHRSLVARLGAQVLGPDEPTAAARIRAGFDDIRHAVTLARRSQDLGALVDLVGGLGGYLRFHQGWEASDWAADTLAMVERAAPDDHECLTVLAGVAAWSQWFAGDLVAAEEIATRALAASNDVHAGTASVLAALAVVHMYNGLPEAVPAAERGLAVALDRGETFLAAYLTGALAITKAYAGDPDAARDDLARQATLVDALDNPSARAWSLYCQAEVAGDHDPERTVRLAREAAELARLARSNLLENVSRITALTVAARHGLADGVRDELSALINRFQRDGAWTHVYVLVWNLVEVLARRGRFEEAAVLLHASPARAPTPYGDQLARLDRGRAEALAALTPETFNAAATRGAGMTREEVATYALEVLEGTLADVIDVDSSAEQLA